MISAAAIALCAQYAISPCDDPVQVMAALLKMRSEFSYGMSPTAQGILYDIGAVGGDLDAKMWVWPRPEDFPSRPFVKIDRKPDDTCIDLGIYKVLNGEELHALICRRSVPIS